MGFIEANLDAGEEIIYQTNPTRSLWYRIVLIFEGVLLVLLALIVPVGLALTTHRFGHFPVVWGETDSLAILVISIGVWCFPLLALSFFSMAVARIFACELAVTNRRVIGRVPSVFIFKTLNLPFDVIARIALKGSRIHLNLKNGKGQFVSGFENAGIFTEVCRVRMLITSSLTPVPLMGEDPTLRLKRLKEALDSGLITEAEYNQKRNQILQQM